MFLKQLAEDFEFENLVHVFDNDKFFLYSAERYILTEEDRKNFEAIKNSELPYRINILEEISLRKLNTLSRVEIVDIEDLIRGISEISCEDLATYPVSSYYSKEPRKAIQLLISILLEKTFFIRLEENSFVEKIRILT